MNSEVSVPTVGKGGAMVDGRSVGSRYRESIGEGARGGNGVMGRERERGGGGRRGEVVTGEGISGRGSADRGEEMGDVAG